MNGGPLDIMKSLYTTVAQKIDDEPEVSKTNWRLTFRSQKEEPKKEESKDDKAKESKEEGEEEEDQVEANNPNIFKIEVELHEVEENANYIIAVTKKGGSIKSSTNFNETFQKLYKSFSEEEQAQN